MNNKIFLFTIFFSLPLFLFARKISRHKKNSNFSIKNNLDEKNLLKKLEKKDNDITLFHDLIIKESLEDIFIVIFIHGTSSGIHTYGLPSGPRPSLKGTYFSIREAFSSLFKRGRENYKDLYSQKSKFAFYKNRQQFFHSDKLPVIMGIFPGLREIPIDSCASFSECTPKAHRNIFVPFLNSFEQNFRNDREICKYYMFNWIGDLSFIDRSEAARVLRSNMLELLKKYFDKKIKFFIFAFSHGGNVLLEAISGTEIKVDYLVCMGTPIGKKTIEWLEKSLIEKVFNFFSYTDKVQIADFLFNFPYFSRRKISLTPSMKSIGNIKNISVSLWDDQLALPFKHHYFYFNSPYFFSPLMCYIPLVMNYFESNKLEFVRLKLSHPGENNQELNCSFLSE